MQKPVFCPYRYKDVEFMLEVEYVLKNALFWLGWGIAKFSWHWTCFKLWKSEVSVWGVYVRVCVDVWMCVHVPQLFLSVLTAQIPLFDEAVCNTYFANIMLYWKIKLNRIFICYCSYYFIDVNEIENELSLHLKLLLF